MTSNEIIVVGSANMDFVVSVKNFPHPGETLFGRSFGMFPGGKGANQAVCCAKLGVATHFIGRIGTDILGEKLAASMQRDGVQLDSLIRDEGSSTGIALITVDRTGQNEIVVVSGGNMRLTPDDIESKQDLFATARVLLVQLETPRETVIRAVSLAKQHNLLTILNPAPACKLPGSLLRMVDYLTPNETEAEILTGIKVKDTSSAERAGRKLLTKGVKHVIVTLGRRGSLLLAPGTAKYFPAPRVKAVDATAAGDAFSGALAVSLAEGSVVEEAIPFATTVAALSVTRMGAQSSLPTREEVSRFKRTLLG